MPTFTISVFHYVKKNVPVARLTSKYIVHWLSDDFENWVVAPGVTKLCIIEPSESSGWGLKPHTTIVHQNNSNKNKVKSNFKKIIKCHILLAG